MNIKSKLWRFLIIFFLLFCCPFLLRMAIGKMSGDAWLQFWGTYLGVIFSGLLALYISREDKKQERKNKILDLYLDDLRTINQELSELNFDGRWSPIFHTEIELSSEDVERIKAIFFDTTKEFYIMKCFPKIKRIIAGMPVQKSEIFSLNVLEVMRDIDNLTYHHSEDFRSDEEMRRKPGLNTQGLKTSKSFIYQMDNLSKSYVSLLKKIDEENNDNNSL